MKLITESVKAKGIPIKVIDVIVDRAKPNAGVMEEIDRTAIQVQNKRTQVERASAELSRKEAERNKADADKAYMREMNFTSSEYLRFREIEVEKEKIEMIKGKGNVNVTMMMGGGAYPIYNVK